MSIRGFFKKYKNNMLLLSPEEGSGLAGEQEKLLVFNQCGRCKNYCKQTTSLMSDSHGFNKFNQVYEHCKKSFDRWWGEETNT